MSLHNVYYKEGFFLIKCGYDYDILFSQVSGMFFSSLGSGVCLVATFQVDPALSISYATLEQRLQSRRKSTHVRIQTQANIVQKLNLDLFKSDFSVQERGRIRIELVPFQVPLVPELFSCQVTDVLVHLPRLGAVSQIRGRHHSSLNQLPISGLLKERRRQSVNIHFDLEG